MIAQMDTGKRRILSEDGAWDLQEYVTPTSPTSSLTMCRIELIVNWTWPKACVKHVAAERFHEHLIAKWISAFSALNFAFFSWSLVFSSSGPSAPTASSGKSESVFFNLQVHWPAAHFHFPCYLEMNAANHSVRCVSWHFLGINVT